MIPHIRFDKPTLYLDNYDLTKDRISTYLTSDTTTSNSTLEVQSITAFAVNKLILIGEIDQEGAELVKTHASTVPSGTTITLDAVMSKAHSKDDKIYLINYDAVEFDWASTITGSKEELSTLAIGIEHPETLYNDTSQSSGFYFGRMYNTIGGTVSANISDWSDPVPYAGYESNTIYEIKKRALNNVGEVIGGKITHSFLNECLFQARREYHDAPGKRPFRRKYGVDIGNVSVGIYRILSPSDLERPQTAENLYGIRIGTENNLSYYDKKYFDQDYRNIPHSTLNVAYAVGNTYLEVANARDFATSGSVSIGEDEIEYSARDLTTGSLTVSADGAESHSVDDDVWQNVSYGLPTKFTVFIDNSGSSYVYFNRPIGTLYANQNIYADYYRTLVSYDSDADTLDEPEFDEFVHYLSWRIKKKLNPELKAQNDDDYNLWITKKNSALSREYLGTEIRFIPDLPDDATYSN